MNTSIVINEVIALFLIIFIGAYGSKKNIITPSVNKGLTDILLKITMPLLIISSFNFSYEDTLKESVISSFYYSLFTFILCAGISYLFLLPVKKDTKYILQFGNVFSNCGFIGFPIIQSIYGSEGVIYTSVFNMFFSILIWTYGVFLFTGKISKEKLKEVMLSPAVVAVYIGVIIMVFNIKIPSILLKPIELVGGMTSPLSMIILGAILFKVDIRKYLKEWTIYYGALIKLIIIPIILYLISSLVGINSKVVNTMILLSAMPVAGMTSIFSENFNKDKEYASILVFVTTLLSIISYPIILNMIN